MEANTEKLILDSAQKVFMLKGFDGARMQHIAEEAGINKALLHYYFRSKEKLFDAIFEDSIKTFMPNIVALVKSEKGMKTKVEGFVNNYMEMLLQNPLLPMFILREINRSPEKIIQIFHKNGIKPDTLLHDFMKKSKKNIKSKISPEHLLINILSLCIFPFIGRPIIEKLLFKENSKKYQKFLEERKQVIVEFVLSAIAS